MFGEVSEHVILTLNLYYRGTKYHSRGVGETETGNQGGSKKEKRHQSRERGGQGQGGESKKSLLGLV